MIILMWVKQNFPLIICILWCELECLKIFWNSVHLATSFIIHAVSSRMFYFQIFVINFIFIDRIADHQKGNVSSILFHFRLSLWLLDLLSLNMFAKTLFILKSNMQCMGASVIWLHTPKNCNCQLNTSRYKTLWLRRGLFFSFFFIKITIQSFTTAKNKSCKNRYII